jgi:hypothetical protein
MAANSVPRYVDPGKSWAVAVGTANTGLDGSGTVATLVTAGANGSLITMVRVKAIVATTAGMIRFFLHDGSAFFLWHEIDVTAATPSGTVKSFAAEYQPTVALVLPSGWSLRVSTHNAEAAKCFAFGGDF